MVNPRIDKQRETLKSLLGAMVDAYEAVNRVMDSEAHSKGIAQRSLEPQSGDFVVHGKKGITCSYTHSNGRNYQISISRGS
jgi:hypothetical protein